MMLTLSKYLYMRAFHCFIGVLESEKNIYLHTHISLLFLKLRSILSVLLLTLVTLLLLTLVTLLTLALSTTATICAPRFGLVGWVVGCTAVC